MGNRAEVCSQWYALRLRSNRERAVQTALRAREIATYLPSYTERVQWSDRVKKAERLLFPGYIFVRSENPAALLDVPGVIQVLPNNMKPTAIADQEIEAVRAVTASQAAQPSAFAVGETVRVERGPMAGQSGVVTRTKGGARLVVNLELLNRAVSVELDSNDVETSL